MAWDKLGDMKKVTYDADLDGIVDEAAALEAGAQADADKIQGVDVDDTAKADQKVLTFVSSSGNIEYITPAPSGATIKSIQQGSITIDQASSSNTLTISEVDTSKSVVIYNGHISANDAMGRVPYLSLTNGTTVTATVGNELAEAVTIKFTVLEFLSGIESVQTGVITMANNDSSEAATISSVDTSKSVVFHGSMGVAGSINDAFAHLVLTNATTITATRQVNAGECKVSYTVLEFS